jgi:hypothetical protein
MVIFKERVAHPDNSQRLQVVIYRDENYTIRIANI